MDGAGPLAQASVRRVWIHLTRCGGFWRRASIPRPVALGFSVGPRSAKGQRTRSEGRRRLSERQRTPAAWTERRGSWPVARRPVAVGFGAWSLCWRRQRRRSKGTSRESGGAATEASLRAEGAGKGESDRSEGHTRACERVTVARERSPASPHDRRVDRSDDGAQRRGFPWP